MNAKFALHMFQIFSLRQLFLLITDHTLFFNEIRCVTGGLIITDQEKQDIFTLARN
jgi:hypothetical protein